jgi:hypothetical protein
VSRPRLLLVPSFTELEWGILPQLEEWAEVASFDMPGVGGESLPADVDPDASHRPELLSRWRAAGVRRGLDEVARRDWVHFLVVTDSHGVTPALRIATERRGNVAGLAIGHAALSHSTEGERAPMTAGVWTALGQLARQGNEAFVGYGISQMTRGGVSEELAEQMVERFPEMDLVVATIEALAEDPEPIGDDLAALGLPLLLAKHQGCLGRTDEGWEDICAAFPEARTVICPETCTSSPAFAEAIERFARAVS